MLPIQAVVSDMDGILIESEARLRPAGEEFAADHGVTRRVENRVVSMGCKSEPEIYLEVLAKIGAAPEHAFGGEGSGNGIRSLRAAGIGITGMPGLEFPPDDDVLALAFAQITEMSEPSLALVEGAAAVQRARAAT